YSPFFSPRPSPPTPTLFPYTTLFKQDTVYTSILLVKLWAFPARKCTINFTAERRNIRPYLTTLQLLGPISGLLVGWWMGRQLSIKCLCATHLVGLMPVRWSVFARKKVFISGRDMRSCSRYVVVPKNKKQWPRMHLIAGGGRA